MGVSPPIRVERPAARRTAETNREEDTGFGASGSVGYGEGVGPVPLLRHLVV